MVKYKHLFFDLDRTIWDFETNSKETITELLDRYFKKKAGQLTFDKFYQVYQKINAELWMNYREAKITKDELRRARFYRSLLAFGIDEAELALEMNENYVLNCSQKTNLIPQSKEVLAYLHKNYGLHIITNGFKEAQYLKIEKSGIKHFFDEVIVADELGIQKPDPRIFHHALEESTAEKHESIMIGDDYEADIIGAKGVGIDQVYFLNQIEHDQNKSATFTVNHLRELKNIF